MYEINAAARRAIFINEVPEKYKKYPVMGRGATSIILDAGHDVLVLTRDELKRSWLTDPFGLNIGEDVEELEVRGHKNRQLSDIPIYVLRMPKLKKLSPQNKRKLKKSLKEFFEIWDKNYNKYFRQAMQRKIRKHDITQYTASDTLIELEDRDPHNMFVDFLRWSTNYGNWTLDFHNGNFAENDKGEIVLLDPIVAKSLYDKLYPENLRPY